MWNIAEATHILSLDSFLALCLIKRHLVIPTWTSFSVSTLFHFPSVSFLLPLISFLLLCIPICFLLLCWKIIKTVQNKPEDLMYVWSNLLWIISKAHTQTVFFVWGPDNFIWHKLRQIYKEGCGALYCSLCLFSRGVSCTGCNQSKHSPSLNYVHTNVWIHITTCYKSW